MDISKKDGLSCFHCSPPTPLSPGILSDVIHLHHIRHQHLYTYKPFSCSHCDQSFVDHGLLASHSVLVHGEAPKAAEEQYRGSKYLDVLCSLMKQCNVYSSCKKDSLAVQLINSTKKQSSMPLGPLEIEFPSLKEFRTPKQEPEEPLPFHITMVEPAPKQPRKAPSKEHLCPSCNKIFLSPTILRIHQQSNCTRVQKKYTSGSKGKKTIKKSKKSQRLLQSVKDKSCDVPPENKEVVNPKQNVDDDFTFRIPAVPQPKMKAASNELLTCPLCSRTFLSPMILHIHRQSKCFPVQSKRSLGGKETKMLVVKKIVATKKPLQTKLSSMVTCRYCAMKFLNFSDLKQHRINVHGTNITEAKKQYYCMECKRNFGCGPIVHVAIFHLKQPVVACSKCDYTHWWKVTNVNQHIGRAHGEGGAQVIDNRCKFKVELNQLKRKMIKSC